MRYSAIFVALITTAFAQDQGVANAINAWSTDINTVNDFLQGGATDANTALNSALDEPNQAKILGAVTNLSGAGHFAADRLAANFPSIPNNLQNLVGGADDPGSVRTAITYDRCCTVLPAIQTLWQESANAVGELLTSNVNFPSQCGQFQCLAF
ncbi:hypothetical protein Q7P36_000431 [Cladosporium allicinum]